MLIDMKSSFDNLKMHKMCIRGDADIAHEFSLALNATLRMCKLKFGGGGCTLFDGPAPRLTFINRFGTAIANREFSSIPEVLLTYFAQSNYYTSVGDAYKLQFPTEAASKFMDICNSFRDTEWDTVLDSFLDALYDLIQAGTLIRGN